MPSQALSTAEHGPRLEASEESLRWWLPRRSATVASCGRPVKAWDHIVAVSLSGWGRFADGKQRGGLGRDPGSASGAVDPAHILLAAQQFRKGLDRPEWQQEALAVVGERAVNDPRRTATVR